MHSSLRIGLNWQRDWIQLTPCQLHPITHANYIQSSQQGNMAGLRLSQTTDIYVIITDLYIGRSGLTQASSLLLMYIAGAHGGLKCVNGAVFLSYI
jgi:hypothetical protein